MLTVPEVLTHQGVVVYPDDEDPNLFYALSGRPRLRHEDGKPVFRGLFWTDAADGSATPSVAGVRGALLHFDINLEVPPALLAEIKQQIEASGVQEARVETMLRDERERLQRLARARGQDLSELPQPRVPEIREMRWGSVQFIDGRVVLLEEESGSFVEWSSAGGPPSLIADNNSAFAIRLGPEGAAVWYRALEQDATAVGVRYELKFQVRLPSLEIHVWAGSHQKLEIERSAERVIQSMDQGCSDVDVERIDVTKLTETLTQEGLVNIEIIKGTAKISDEHVSQLRNAALTLISDRVKEVLQHKIRGMTEEERQSSLLQMVTEEVSAFAELRLTQRDVIEWNVNPQATITDFLGGLTGETRKQLITLVDLSDPVVSTLEVPVTVSAPWDGTPSVTRVVVTVEYPAARDDPRRIQTFAFDKANAATPQVFRCRRVKRDKGLLKYSAQAFLLGSAEPVAVRHGETNGAIHVEVPRLGSFVVKARPHPNTFGLGGVGKVTAVQVNYTYKSSDVPDHVSGGVVIRSEQLENGALINHTTFREIDAPIKYRPVFLRESDPAIEGPEQQVWVKTGQEALIELPAPWPDSIRVGVFVPPSDGLKKVRVELRHQDQATGFTSDAPIDIEEDDGEWRGRTTLVQVDKTNQRFQYRYSVQGDGQRTTGPWADAEGDQELTLPLLAVKLRPDRLRLGTDFSEAIVRLVYTDPARSYETSHEFFLTKDAQQATWLVPRVNPNLDTYRYSLLLFPESGEPIEVEEREGRGANLILQSPV